MDTEAKDLPRECNCRLCLLRRERGQSEIVPKPGDHWERKIEGGPTDVLGFWPAGGFYATGPAPHTTIYRQRPVQSGRRRIRWG